MLKIGHLRLDFPVVQAALSGYSDGPMCLIARRHGAPCCLHEVVLDRSVVQPGRLRRQLLTLDQEDHPVGGQLMGADPARLAAAAETMSAAGFDFVDLNFACPVRKVLGRGRGGHLLSEPSRAIEIIKRVRDAVPRETPVTLKMRRGMDDSATSERDFSRIFDAAFDAGLAAVTLHGRTVKQRYAGPSDWQFIERAKRRAGNQTVLGSGDLFAAEDIRRMLDQTGIDGVTVARGCLGNPWIFEETRALLAGDPPPQPPSVPEQGRVIREHFDLSVAAHGERRGARIMRRFGIKYADLHPEHIAVRDAFVASKTAADWLAVLDKWYDPTRPWAPGRRKPGPDHSIATGARRCE